MLEEEAGVEGPKVGEKDVTLLIQMSNLQCRYKWRTIKDFHVADHADENKAQLLWNRGLSIRNRWLKKAMFPDTRMIPKLGDTFECSQKLVVR
ncbi:unnamed protein product [Gongylonema pulchrum]|uniref:DUF1115 domain-containing protein n=1 Tax=Gongylonema pulchrum TaxID=637853 RepID=A0A183CZC1_9BILA|nr:unnamed protein product [Gongylonema pulchrum]